MCLTVSTFLSSGPKEIGFNSVKFLLLFASGPKEIGFNPIWSRHILCTLRGDNVAATIVLLTDQFNTQ